MENNTTQIDRSSICKLIETGRKVAAASLAGAILASPLIAAPIKPNPHHGPDWIPPGQENKVPPPSPYVGSQSAQKAQYDQMTDWFLYKASPQERLDIVCEFGPEMPELYNLYFKAVSANK